MSDRRDRVARELDTSDRAFLDYLVAKAIEACAQRRRRAVGDQSRSPPKFTA